MKIYYENGQIEMIIPFLDTIKDTGKDNIKGKITDASVEKIVTSETSDWTTHRSQIEYSKQPFLTDIEIKGVK